MKNMHRNVGPRIHLTMNPPLGGYDSDSAVNTASESLGFHSSKLGRADLQIPAPLQI